MKNFKLKKLVYFHKNVYYSKENYQTKDNSVFLCSNHNHFIFVDDGSQNEFGKEIEFRAQLENELRKGRSLTYYQGQSTRKYKRMKSGTFSSCSDNASSIQFDQATSSTFSAGIDGVPMILIVVQGIIINLKYLQF